MEKFMFLFRGSDVYRPDESAEALQSLTKRMIDWVGDITEKEIHVSSEKLDRDGKRVNGLSSTLSDFPFGDDKQVIGGLTIVHARDMKEAIEIARRCPILETNASIEIRPILSM